MIMLAVDDTLCRKRGLTVYGAGMHHDPLISSRARPLTSWGHDWVVVTLIMCCPFWAPTKVWSELADRFPYVPKSPGFDQGSQKDQGGENLKTARVSWIPPAQRILENSDCQAYRIYQPRRLTARPRAPSRDLRLAHRSFSAAPNAAARSTYARKPRNVN